MQEDAVGFREGAPRRSVVIEDESSFIHFWEKIGAHQAVTNVGQNDDPDRTPGQHPGALDDGLHGAGIETHDASEEAGKVRFFRSKERRHVGAFRRCCGGNGFLILPANQILTERRSPRQGQKQGGEERHGHGDGQGAEEGAGHAGSGNQGKKDDDGGNRRADQRYGQFLQRALDGLKAGLPGVPVQNNIFKDDNGVVDDQAHCGGETAQGHQVEALIRRFQNNESDQQRNGNHQAGHERSSPVTQEQHQNDRRKHDSQEHSVPNARDGIVDDGRLVVERFKMHARRKSGSKLLDQRVHFVGDRQSIAFGLAVHIEQHGGFPVGRDHRVSRRYRRSDRGNVAQPNRHARR